MDIIEQFFTEPELKSFKEEAEKHKGESLEGKIPRNIIEDLETSESFGNLDELHKRVIYRLLKRFKSPKEKSEKVKLNNRRDINNLLVEYWKDNKNIAEEILRRDKIIQYTRQGIEESAGIFTQKYKQARYGINIDQGEKRLLTELSDLYYAIDMINRKHFNRK